jgi:hypothetical protein
MAGAEADQCTGGLNFVTLRPRRDVLTDYRTILQRIYRPAAYFERVRAVGRALGRPNHGGALSKNGSRRRLEACYRPQDRVLRRLREIRILGRLARRVAVRQPLMPGHFWRAFKDCARANPAALEYVIIMMVLYLHLGRFAGSVIKDLDRRIGALDGVNPPMPARDRMHADRLPAAPMS